jgi:hypothetical protein
MLEVAIHEHQIQIGQRFAVSCQRTLRVPENDQTYPLPPGLGVFPLLAVQDYRDQIPDQWGMADGALIPMYQREALWLGFSAAAWKPNAVKIAIGGVNAISGEPDDDQLHSNPQNYIVCPNQPWLDGIHSGQGSIQQFVAVPLGQGDTIEAAMTGTEVIGGIQIVVFEPKPGRFADHPPPAPERGLVRSSMPLGQMGLGAGGRIKQTIYPDPYGLETWDQENYGRIAIHLINSRQFRAITAREPPPTLIDAKTYTEYGLPWFVLYDEAKGELPPTEAWNSIQTISERAAQSGEAIEQDTTFEVSDAQIEQLSDQNRQSND